MDANEIIERRSCISGIGQSDVGRRLGRDPLALTADACLAAIEDAGLRREEIDGLSWRRHTEIIHNTPRPVPEHLDALPHVVDEYKRGGVTAQARDSLNAAMDRMRRRGPKQPP